MSKAQTIGTAAIGAGIVVFALALLLWLKPSDAPAPQPEGETPLGGLVHSVIEYFFDGVVIGTQLEKWETLTMTAGSNQVSLRNTSGRTRYITDVQFTTGGTATTSYVFYGSTSTAATFSADYTQPPTNAQHFAIHGATIATSTGPRTFSATTSPTGLWPYPWNDGEYFVFQMQEKFGCGRAANASHGVKCESATSTNTGLGNIKVRVKWIQEDNG